MKNKFHLAVIVCLLLTLINLIGASINQPLNYFGQFKDILEVMPLHAFFALLFWLTCFPKIKMALSLRLPILIMSISTFMVTLGIVNNNRMYIEDTLYLANQSFCFLFNTIGLAMNKIELPFFQHSYSELFVFHILLMAVYQFSIIKLAEKIYTKFSNVIV